MSTAPTGPVFRLGAEERYELLRALEGEEVWLAHAPNRGPEADDRTLLGRLVAVARAPFSPSHVAVLLVSTQDRGRYHLAVPLSQVRWVRRAVPR